MRPNSNQSPYPSAADALSWLLNLATRLLARALNMPEPLVYHTGVFVYVRVQEVETRVGRSLCPVRLWRWIRALTQQRSASALYRKHTPQNAVLPVELMPHDGRDVQKHDGPDEPCAFIVKHFAGSRQRCILGQKTRPMEHAEPGKRVAACRGESIAGERHEEHHHIQ